MAVCTLTRLQSNLIPIYIHCRYSSKNTHENVIVKSRHAKNVRYRKHNLDWPSWKLHLPLQNNHAALGLTNASPVKTLPPRLPTPRVLTPIRSKSDGDLSDHLALFFQLRETLSKVKEVSDDRLRELLGVINGSIEKYLENNQISEDLMEFLESVMELAGLCGEIIGMEVTELLSIEVCARITSDIQKYMTDWNYGVLDECETFPIVHLVIIH